MLLNSESDIRKWAFNISKLGPKRGVPELFDQLTTSPKQCEDKALATLVHCLCTKGGPWIAALHKSLGRDGRCPKNLRPVIKALLHRFENAGIRSSIPEALRQGRVGVAKVKLHVGRKEELGIGNEQRILIAKLHKLYAFQDKGPVDLDIYFECDRIYIYGLALIAAWCARFAANVTITASHTQVVRYLEQIGFTHAVQNHERIISPTYDSENFVALTHVLRERKDIADKLASELVTLLCRHLPLVKESRDACTVMFAELIENIYRHSESSYPSYVIAQAHPTQKRLHVVVVDTGIGIYDSFRRSDSAFIKNRARSEYETIRMAIERYVTSKIKGHSGYGLYVISELMARNGGILRLTSGSTTLLQQPTRKGLRRKTISISMDNHPQWKGTELAIQFNLELPLPLQEVYNTLLLPGAEDFVD